MIQLQEGNTVSSTSTPGNGSSTNSISQRQRFSRTTMEASDRNSTGGSISSMKKSFLIDGSTESSDHHRFQPEAVVVSERQRKLISPRRLDRSTTGTGQKSILLIFISFLFGMRLSFDFFHHYIHFIPSSLSSLPSSSTTTDTTYSSTISLYETVQMTLLQEAERTSDYIRDAFMTTISDTSSQDTTKPTIIEENSILIDPNRTYTKYAYAYVIGGCDPYNPSYRGFLYNVMVSTRILRDLGSINDVVLFIQLSYNYIDGITLPNDDVTALDGLNIHIYYIKPSPYESFYDTVMNKFRILQLIQYRRIILMDGDVMPISNLDYLFLLSDNNIYGPNNSTLKPNLIVAGPWEPANAGFFMLAPEPGDYEHICSIIERREQRVKLLHSNNTDILFDEYEGWGHIIQSPDEWVSRKQHGTNWTFHFAFSDQGLLYHWTKYVKKSVSIVFYEHVENLSTDSDGKPYLERDMPQLFKNYSQPLIETFGSCHKFMCDFIHFTGLLKPWLRKPPDDLSLQTKLKDSSHIWWYYLTVIDQELSLGLDFDHWVSPGRPTHGLYATWGDMRKKDKFKSATDAESSTSK